MSDEGTIRGLIGPTLAGIAASEAYIPPRSIVKFERGSIDLVSSYEGAERDVTIALSRYAKGFVVHRFLFGVENWTIIPEQTLRLATLVDAGDLAGIHELTDELRRRLVAHISKWRKDYARYNAMRKEARRLFDGRSVATDEEWLRWRPEEWLPSES